MDKIIFAVLLLIAGGSVVAYQTSHREPAKPGPVARIMDRFGLGRDEVKDSLETNTQEYNFTVEMQKNLIALDQKHFEIQQQRMALLERRRAILSDLDQMYSDVNALSEQYLAQLREEQKSFLMRLAEMRQTGDDLQHAAGGDDSQSMDEKLQAFKQHFLQLFARVVQEGQEQQAQEETQRMLSDMEAIVYQEDPLILDSCGGLEYCLEIRIEGLEHKIDDMFDASLRQPEEDVKKLLALLPVMQREYKIMTDNLNAVDRQLDAGYQKLDDEYQDFAQGLMQASDQDVEKLARLYRELREEQRIFMENLQINRQRLADTLQANSQRVQAMADHLPRVKTIDSSNLRGRLLDLERQQQVIFDRVADNHQQVRNLVGQQAQDHKYFIEQMMVRLKVDTRRLMANRSDRQKMDQTQQDIEDSRRKKELTNSKVQRRQQQLDRHHRAQDQQQAQDRIFEKNSNP